MSENSTAHATTTWPHPASAEARASSRWTGTGAACPAPRRPERDTAGRDARPAS